MDRVSAEVGGNVLALLENPQHPVAKARRLLDTLVRWGLLLCSLLLCDLAHCDIGCDTLRGAALRDVGRRWQSNPRDELTVSFSPRRPGAPALDVSRSAASARVSLYCDHLCRLNEETRRKLAFVIM